MSLVETVKLLISDDGSPVASKLESLSTLLVELKAVNRDAFTRLRDAKKVTQRERTTFDEQSITLNSVQYQRAHLESEILDCQNFPTTFDKIDLVPLEQFMEGNMLEADPHQLMIARLNDELERRKRYLLVVYMILLDR